MIVPDLNLLIYAYHAEDPNHEAARRWWEGLLDGVEAIGVPWTVSTGFIRLMTNPRMLQYPMSAPEAIDIVEGWFQYAHIRPLEPSASHLGHLRRILRDAGAGAGLVPDAHIAAIAIEFNAEVHSNDSDFAKFPGVRWRNPLNVSERDARN